MISIRNLNLKNNYQPYIFIWAFFFDIRSAGCLMYISFEWTNPIGMKAKNKRFRGSQGRIEIRKWLLSLRYLDISLFWRNKSWPTWLLYHINITMSLPALRFEVEIFHVSDAYYVWHIWYRNAWQYRVINRQYDGTYQSWYKIRPNNYANYGYNFYYTLFLR